MICFDDAVPADDAAIDFRDGRCICERCYLRETEQQRRLSKRLTRDVEDALKGAQG